MLWVWPKSAKVLVLNTPAPNLPFILLNRKGYALMGWRAEDIQLAMEWDADVVVIQNKSPGASAGAFAIVVPLRVFRRKP
jgi:hypothetical protein